MKTCNKCGESKPLDAFSKNKTSPDGLNYKCKACDSAYQAERYKTKAEQIKANAKRWAAENPDRKKENHAKWREENNEYRKQYQREWWAANAEAQRQKQAEWRAANKEFIAKRNAEWRHNNPGKDLALSRGKKAAKLKRTPRWADKAAIAGIYEEAARRRASGEDVHVDHIIPLQGKTISGLHVHWNLRIVSAAENLAKRNKYLGHPGALV